MSTPAPSTASRNAARSPWRSRASVHRYSRARPASRRGAARPSRARSPEAQNASAWARRFTSVPRCCGDRLDRRARQRVVRGEQPAQRLVVREAAVDQQGQRAVQPAHDLVAVQERGRHAERAVGRWTPSSLRSRRNCLIRLTGQPEPLSDLGNGEPVADHGVGRGVDLCHVSKLSTSAAGKTPVIIDCPRRAASAAHSVAHRNGRVGQPRRRPPARPPRSPGGPAAGPAAGRRSAARPADRRPASTRPTSARPDRPARPGGPAAPW